MRSLVIAIISIIIISCKNNGALKTDFYNTSHLLHIEQNANMPGYLGSYLNSKLDQVGYPEYFERADTIKMVELKRSYIQSQFKLDSLKKRWHVLYAYLFDSSGKEGQEFTAFYRDDSVKADGVLKTALFSFQTALASELYFHRDGNDMKRALFIVDSMTKRDCFRNRKPKWYDDHWDKVVVHFKGAKK